MLSVWSDGHCADPVVAMTSTIYDDYIEVFPVIVENGEFCVCDHFWHRENTSSVSELVNCTWPESDDEQRLQPTVDELRGALA